MDLKLVPVYAANGLIDYYDIEFVKGKLQVVDGIDEIKNRLLINLSVFRGENFTNREFGTDYFNNVFGRDVTDPVLIDEIKASILKTRGVTELKSLDITRDGRTAVIKADVKTSIGEINLATPITI